MSLERLYGLLRGNLVVLTGAGISVESGLPTFRGAGGMYEGRNVEDLATPEGFARDPEFVWRWYAERMGQVLQAEPNAGHAALVSMERTASSFTLITSNVDNLHEKAGSLPFKLHGSILEARCTVTGEVYPLTAPPEGVPLSPEGHAMRPNVVWFGERPNQEAVSEALDKIPRADLVIEVGVSGNVTYGFADMAVQLGIPLLCINPDTSGAPYGAVRWSEPAAKALPDLVRFSAE